MAMEEVLLAVGVIWIILLGLFLATHGDVLYNIRTRLAGWIQYNQEESQHDISVAFYKATGLTRGPSEGLVLERNVSESKELAESEEYVYV